MIKEFLIGLLVFVIVTLVLFQSAGDFNTIYSVNTSNAPSGYDYGYTETNALMADITSKAPGGSGSIQGESGDAETDTDLGFKTGAKIIGQGVPIFKNIILGNNETNPGIMSELNIRKEFQTLIVSAFIVIIALILISSLLRNKIT